MFREKIGITGNYRVYKIYDATPDFPASKIVDNLRWNNYSYSDQDTYEYIEKNFPTYEVSIVPSTSEPPYEECWDYHIGYIEYLRVTIM